MTDERTFEALAMIARTLHDTATGPAYTFYFNSDEGVALREALANSRPLSHIGGPLPKDMP